MLEHIRICTPCSDDIQLTVSTLLGEKLSLDKTKTLAAARDSVNAAVDLMRICQYIWTKTLARGSRHTLKMLSTRVPLCMPVAVDVLKEVVML